MVFVSNLFAIVAEHENLDNWRLSFDTHLSNGTIADNNAFYGLHFLLSGRLARWLRSVLMWRGVV